MPSTGTGVHVTVTEAFPGVTVGAAGGLGRPATTKTRADSDPMAATAPATSDDDPPCDAATAIPYVVPSVKLRPSLTKPGESTTFRSTNAPPGTEYALTTYDTIAAPPSDTGTCHVTRADEGSPVAVTDNGADGRPGTTAVTDALVADEPFAFLADT